MKFYLYFGSVCKLRIFVGKLILSSKILNWVGAITDIITIVNKLSCQENYCFSNKIILVFPHRDLMLGGSSDDVSVTSDN